MGKQDKLTKYQNPGALMNSSDPKPGEYLIEKVSEDSKAFISNQNLT